MPAPKTWKAVAEKCLDCGRLTQRRDRRCTKCVKKRNEIKVQASEFMRQKGDTWCREMESLTGYDAKNGCSHPRRPGEKWCRACGRRVA